MRDFSAIHDMDWLEEISPGNDKNSVRVRVRTMNGGKATFQIATRPLLKRMEENDANRKKKTQK